MDIDQRKAVLDAAHAYFEEIDSLDMFDTMLINERLQRMIDDAASRHKRLKTTGEALRAIGRTIADNIVFEAGQSDVGM